MKIVWPESVSAPAEKRASQKLGLRKPSAPKKTRPRPVSAKWTPTETISSTSTRRVGEALVGEAIDQRAEQRDDRERQHALRRAGAA